MTSTINMIQRLVTRESSSHEEAVVTRQGLRTRKARPGRHPATSSLVLVLGCWNVRSLGIQTHPNSCTPRKSAVIDHELSRLGINVAALSETWLTGNGSIRETNYTFFWCGYPDPMRPKHGIGFAVHNNLLSCIQQPISISPRLMTMRMCLKDGYITIISAYAPTLKASSESKDEFYEGLNEAILRIPAGDNIALIGDFNARIGSDFNAWSNVMGQHGIGKMNENGQRLLELCAAHSLCLTSTFFGGSMCSKTTWMHPRSRRWHQLDHIIVRRRQLCDVKNCRSLHSADCNTDHALVRCKLKISPKRFHRAKPKPVQSVNTSATKDPSCVSKFRELLAGHFTSTVPRNPEAAWSRFRSAVSDSALSAFGIRSRRQPDWFTDNADTLLPALQTKRIARNKVRIRNTRSAKAEYRKAKNLVQRCTREALHHYWKQLSNRIQTCSDTGDLRGLYSGIKEAIGPIPKRSAPLLSINGEILHDPSEQLKRWMEHFSSLYSTDAEIDPDALCAIPQLTTLYELDSTINLEEVRQAISRLKNNKSPGPDGIPSEVFKTGGDVLTAELLKVFQVCWQYQCIPQDLKDSNIITLYKNKGSRQDCNNYRGISLLNLAGKILARVILPRLQVIAARILPESQCGFRASRSTVDMVFSLRQLQEKCIEQQRPLYVVFVDLSKAFDNVSRSGLYSILKRLGCPDTLLSLLIGFHQDMKATVQCNGERSETINIMSGVKQGCVLAPTLFGIFLSALLLRAFPQPSGIMLHTRSTGRLFNLSRLRAKTKIKQVLVHELLYADDAAIVAHSEAALQESCSSLARACSEFGMKINTGKTVTLVQGAVDPPVIMIDGKPLSVVTKFAYLGSLASSTNSLDAELDTRIGKAATTFGRLRTRVWNNRNLTIKLKTSIYIACVISVLLYCSESWVTYRHQEKRLNSFHFRCLRSILGISWRDRVPNTSVLLLTGTVDMFTILRRRRLRWSGHICRQDEGRLPKNIFYGELANSPRPRGRPKLRFKDVLKRDLTAFNIPTATWETVAHDRELWRSTLSSGYKFSADAYITECERRRALRHQQNSYQK